MQSNYKSLNWEAAVIYLNKPVELPYHKIYFYREALFSVARRFFEEIELGGDEVKVCILFTVRQLRTRCWKGGALVIRIPPPTFTMCFFVSH